MHRANANSVASRHFSTLLLISLLGMLAASVPPAHAYYDDVHYALTYYVARQVGYTPLQAERIAIACLSVDYDSQTEPVQPTAQKATLVGVQSWAQNPRWKFHAFRNELQYNDPVGNGPDAGAADAAIRDQRDYLWEQALSSGNPGVFLHFLQDEPPHARYGSAWGHWPLDPTVFPRALRDRLPVGGTTDWVFYRRAATAAVIEETALRLLRFMQKASPYQRWRPHRAGNYSQVLRELAEVNRSPTPIDTELKRELYARFFGALDPVVPAQPGASDIANLASQLRGKPPADFEKHKNGPDLNRALRVVNDALARAGMTDRIGPNAFHYDLDGDGGLADKNQRDKWVLTGTLKVEVRRELTSGDEVAVPRAQVAVFMNQTSPEDREYRLGEPRSVIGAGQPVVFENLPIGWVIIEATTPNQPPVRKKFLLDGQVNQTFITLKAEKPPLALSEKFLRDVVVGSRQITITVWDTACEDGDRITVRVNGIAVFENHPLLNRKESRTVALPSDDNTIEVFANNGGTDCPPGQTPLDKTINSGAIAISGAVSGGSQDWQIRQRTGTTARLTVDPTRATGTTAPPQLPGFLQPSAKPGVQAPPSLSGGSPAGAPNAPPKLPGFLAGETASSAKPPAASPLAAPDPWNNPLIQAHIDEWLRTAVPTSAKQGESWRFSDWGVVLAPGARTAGPPDHPAGWTRHQTVWSVRTKLDSLNTCTLGEFVERRVGGRGLDGCAKPVASVAAKPPVASTSAGVSGGSTGARPALPAPAAPAPRKVEPAPRGERETVADFTGYWNCASRPTDNRRAGSLRAQPWSGAVQIARTGGNSFLLKSEQIQLPSSYATGNRIGFAVEQDFGSARDNLQIFSGYVSIKIDLTLSNGALSGAARVEESGDSASSSLNCTRGQPAGQRAPLGVGKK